MEILRRGVHSLRFDPDFVAGKKEQREQELNEAAEQFDSIEIAEGTGEEARESSKKMKKHTRGFSHRSEKILMALTAASTSATAKGENNCSNTTLLEFAEVTNEEISFTFWMVVI